MEIDEEEQILYPTMEEPCVAKFRDSRRGKQICIDSSGYQYRVNKEHENVTNWSCVKKPKCKATCATKNDTKMIIRWSGHNHDPDAVELKVQKIEQGILETAAKQPRLSTGHLIQEWQKATLGPAEKAYLPSKRTMNRKICRIKKDAKEHPDCPQSFEDLEDIPIKFQSTFDGRRFILANALTEQGRIIIYSSDHGLRLLKRAEIWTLDGTFGIVPKPFKQLYSVMVEIDGYSYPAAFCLLPNKTSQSYRFVFEKLNSKLETMAPIRLRQAVMDFESPALNEFRAAFGPHVRVTGCIVHFGRSLRRQQGKIGGLLSWQKKERFQVFTNCLKGLAYVPPRHVIEYYQALLGPEMEEVIEELDQDEDIKMEVKDVMKENLNHFLEYFEQTYLGKKGRTGWLKGRFALELWNQHDNVLEGRQTSTNCHEGWHSRMRKAIQTSNTYWSLIDQLIDVEGSTRANREDDLERGHNDQQTGSSRAKKEVRLNNKAKLRQIVSKIDEYEIIDYLKKVAYYKYDDE
jgi:hypothetical protein